MNVGIIGSGGREHAICLSLKNSSKVNKIYCLPGNAGTYSISNNINVDINNFEELKKTIVKFNIDVVIVGPEKPLVEGLVDFLQENKIKVFGPNKVASQLEGSKTFTKNLCKKYNIPTADYKICFDLIETIEYIKKSKFPLVLKADGLAAGKGVYICKNFEDAKSAANEVFNGKFGEAKKILVEEFLNGEEMSFFVISDGNNFYQFGTAQDHKRVFEGDQGKNTGGMGAYSPSRLESSNLNNKILNKIIKPTLKGLSDLNTDFQGFLYAGLMIVNDEPYLIEYNVRMGDPECQTILPKLKTDFGEIIEACINKTLNMIKLDWHEDKSLCIVLCSKGYPDKFINNIEIENLNNIILQKNEYIFHAGTRNEKDKVFSNGGRVLNIVIRSNNFKNGREKAIKIINNINWSNGFYRKDIGYKVIDK
tara:strand:+ start:6429 stop:7694 length:1266 start_codon:yes stop_codon:yes gene_type:complete